MKNFKLVSNLKAALIITVVLLYPALKAEDLADPTAKYKVEAPYEAPKGKIFNEDAFLRGELAINQFRNVIVINKAAKGPRAQTARIYINRNLVLRTKVSTGREDVEVVDFFDSIFRGVLGGRGTTQSHWRHTVRGFYPITRVMDWDYQSSESKFHMPYAMFFDDKRGLALHQVPPDISGGEAAGIAALGSRASSGCIRFGKNEILYTHNLVIAADKGHVPVIDSRTGLPVLDKSGQAQYRVGWNSIVIIEEY